MKNTRRFVKYELLGTTAGMIFIGTAFVVSSASKIIPSLDKKIDSLTDI